LGVSVLLIVLSIKRKQSNLPLSSKSCFNSLCSDVALQIQLKQDLEDNGKLDCLRLIDKTINRTETPNESNIRLAAQWDSNCAFEAE
jgi:hypothetical protein